MSKIFITGMSAPQVSPNANSRALSFAGVLNTVLTDAGHDVTWSDPSVHMTDELLNQYDSVLVGVAPLTSVGSNRAYGALHVINKMWESGKLTLFVDSPNSSQIEVSIRAISKNHDNLTKAFYSYRKEYDFVVSDLSARSSVLMGIERLLTDDWVGTIYPALPWKYENQIKLPTNAKVNLQSINLDSYLLNDVSVNKDRREKWVVDSPNSPWAKDTVKTISLPHSPMKWNKGWSDEQVFEQIGRSIGVLISPDKKDGTWWNYRYVQALNSETPIVTDWKESSRIGEAWGLLASNIDSMSQPKRDLIATAQRESYVANIPTKKAALEKLQQTLNLDKEN